MKDMYVYVSQKSAFGSLVRYFSQGDFTRE